MDTINVKYLKLLIMLILIIALLNLSNLAIANDEDVNVDEAALKNVEQKDLIMNERLDYSTSPINSDLSVDICLSGELMFLNLDQINEELESYNLTPIHTKLLPAFGINAAFELQNKLILGAIFLFGTQTSEGKEVKAYETVTYAIMFGGTVGYELGYNFQILSDIGYSLIITGMMGDGHGGMLMHQGPFIRPKVRYIIFDKLLKGAISLGYYIQIPQGRAHNIAYMDEPFNRPIISGFTFALEIGIGNREIF